MEEIDLNNIVEGGRRTRGKVIDFAKAAEQTKDLPVEEDEEEDDDYEAPEAAADEMEH
jgi:histone chaperone CHZ-like protein